MWDHEWLGAPNFEHAGSQGKDGQCQGCRAVHDIMRVTALVGEGIDLRIVDVASIHVPVPNGLSANG